MLTIAKYSSRSMSYGNKQWAEWVLEKDEALEHFKAAYEVCKLVRPQYPSCSPDLTVCCFSSLESTPGSAQEVIKALPPLEADMSVAEISTADVYSNGDSERLVGEAIRKFDIPRE